MDFQGLKVTQDRHVPRLFPDVRPVQAMARVHDLILSEGLVGSGMNSGFQALNLALHFGARRIILVGYDFTLQHGHHWHGRHQDGLNNPTAAGVDVWRAHLDRQAPLLEALGVDLRVASPYSTLTAYRRMSWEDAWK